MTDCSSFERTLTELKIARAYGRLSSIPGNGPEASIMLDSIGSCEIRMLRGPEVHPDGVPLFWLELFDHSIKMSVDGCSCHRLKDAVPVVCDFFAQVDDLNKLGES